MAATTPIAAGVCSYAVSPAAVQMPGVGGTFQVSITAQAGSTCPWTASTSDEWIRPVGATTGQGTASVEMAVLPAFSSTRHGAVTVSWAAGAKSIVVDQTGPCPFASTLNLSAESQRILLGVACTNSLQGSVSIDVAWIHFQGTHGAGSQLDVLVDANTGLERTGHITTSFGQYTFVQTRGDCVTAIAPANQSFDENGGTGSFTVTAVPGCAWEATVNAETGSLNIVAGGRGNGNGMVTFNLGINTSPIERSPYFLFVGGPQRFQITQRACPVTVSPVQFHVTAAGGSFPITVMSREICQWTASSDFPFVTVSVQGTTGPATIQLGISENQTGQTRFGLARIAANNITVTQDPR